MVKSKFEKLITLHYELFLEDNFNVFTILKVSKDSFLLILSALSMFAHIFMQNLV